MTQTDEKNKPEDRRADHDPPAEETNLEELVNEELAGVHVLGEGDMKKHFGRLEKEDSDTKGQGKNR